MKSHSTSSPPTPDLPVHAAPAGLRKVVPYWYPHTTMAKERWWGREILEVVSTEFRDRSTEYYRYALASGVTTINGKPALPGTIIHNGDLLENVTHRHEPPVTSDPIRVLHRNDAREFVVVDKPGSIPVHATGRYFQNSMVEILKHDFGLHVYTVNRLDRLTSGLLILPTSARAARALTDEFTRGGVRKEYVARCMGEFPAEEVVCEQPLLTVDRQMGLNIVHPDGKHAKTIFNRIRYDSATDTSVLHCQPVTGRSHQIRVHLQFLGHPIANDTVYCDAHIWGPELGKGGLDLTPSDERTAPAAPMHLGFATTDNPETRARADAAAAAHTAGDRAAEHSAPAPDADADEAPPLALLPRETGHDIGLASPVPLSAEAVGVITRLRHLKDQEEDWARWRDTAFRGAPALRPAVVAVAPKKPPKQRVGEGKKKKVAVRPNKLGPGGAPPTPGAAEGGAEVDTNTLTPAVTSEVTPVPDAPPTPVFAPTIVIEPYAPPTGVSAGPTYCEECFVPLAPDPAPERLYIFLHALRYTTALGTFETGMPAWAAAGWTWSERGPGAGAAVGSD